jgi:serine/threonine protein kinase
MTTGRLDPGQTFLHFRIVRLLGEGGMGAVYEAEHEFTKRRVALKVIHTHRANTGDFRTRMIQEARTVADLSHPNVVTLYDANMTDDGTVWMATEYLEGQTLRDLMTRSGLLPVREALAYLIEACDGVAAGHERGVIHRDLKPENLFVTREGKLKVLDYGASKVRDRGLVKSTEIAALGGRRSVIGTPEYMSPEHLGGRSVDERTDVYALGTIGYELLLRHPLGNEDGSLPVMVEMCRRQIAEIPKPLSETAPHLPPCLSPIFDRALQKDRENRYRRVADMAADLREAARECERVLISEERAPFEPRWVGPGGYQVFGPQFSLPQHPPGEVPSKPVVVQGASAATNAPQAPAPNGTQPLAPVPVAAPASSDGPGETPRAFTSPALSTVEQTAPQPAAGTQHTTQPLTVHQAEHTEALRIRRRIIAGAFAALLFGMAAAFGLVAVRPGPSGSATEAAPAPGSNIDAPDAGAVEPAKAAEVSPTLASPSETAPDPGGPASASAAPRSSAPPPPAGVAVKGTSPASGMQGSSTKSEGKPPSSSGAALPFSTPKKVAE